jgi:hypothetical protein
MMSTTAAAADTPIVISGTRWETQWVDLRYSSLPQWRRLAAHIPDGRVMLAAENFFENAEQAKEAAQQLGRPWASTTLAGRDYLELDVIRHDRRGDEQALERLQAIEDVVRATVAAAHDPAMPNGIANPAAAGSCSR